MRNFKIFPVLILGIFFFAPLKIFATTYVIREGDQEVGRYDEPDGKDEVTVIQNEKPKLKPVPLEQAPLEIVQDDPLLERVTNSLRKDPQFVKYLNRQPWMKELRAWDTQYHLEKRLRRYQPLILRILFLLIGFAVLFRIYRIIRWFMRWKKKKKTETPDAPQIGYNEKKNC